jgi:hypothetical protein
MQREVLFSARDKLTKNNERIHIYVVLVNQSEISLFCGIHGEMANNME